jgi:hypothetical protein
LLSNFVSCSPINGDVVTLIPGQIILFEEPDDSAVLAAGETHFADTDGRRYFGSAFYADLLSHLGTRLVICFDEFLPATCRAAFSAAEIECCTLEDLCSGAAGRFSLQSLDRFITLATTCPGLVAVQCCGAFSNSIACTHLAALMLRQNSFFSTAHGVAWMQMAHPGRLTESIDLAQLERQLSLQMTRKVRRDRSYSVSVSAGATFDAGVQPDTEPASGPSTPLAGSSPRHGFPTTPTPPSRASGPTSPRGLAWMSPTFSTSSPILLTGLDSDTDEHF